MSHETIGTLLGTAIGAALAPMFDAIEQRLTKLEEIERKPDNELRDEISYLGQRVNEIAGQIITDDYIIEELIKPRLNENALGNAIKNYLDDHEEIIEGRIDSKLNDTDFSNYFDITDSMREVLNNANVTIDF